MATRLMRLERNNRWDRIADTSVLTMSVGMVLALIPS